MKSARYVPSILFCLIFVFFYNTIIDTPFFVKYIVSVLIMAACAFFTKFDEGENRFGVPWQFILWSIFSIYIIYITKVDESYDNSKIILFIFGIFICFFSFIYFSKIKIDTFLLSLFAVMFSVVMMIFINFAFLSNYDLKDQKIGTLSYDSYPIFSFCAGILLLISLYLFQKSYNTKIKSYIELVIFSVAFVLAAYVILNGLSRGEALICMFVLLVYCFPYGFIVVASLLFPVVPIAIMTIDIPVFERLRLGIEDGFSDRTELLSGALEVISSGSDVLVFGLGINGFQRMYGLDPALFVHNSALEMLISGGILGLFIYLLLFVYPILRSYASIKTMKDKKYRILFCIYLFVFMISLKSQSIFSYWQLYLFVPLIFICMWRAKTVSSQ